MTALTFEVVGDTSLQFQYVLLIGVSTASLYCAHRVIGLRKLEHVVTYPRYTVIRKYKQHIWLYCFGWLVLSVWFLLPIFSLELLLWLVPGGSIALAYVFPWLTKGRRLRDLGWIKIIMIGWSWAWLTAFLPAYYFEEIPLFMSVIIALERMIFIIAITIPFEIRDIAIDSSVGLLTMPSKFGIKKTLLSGRILCSAAIFLSMIISYHFLNPAYAIAMILIVMLTLWILKKGQSMEDDYFFSGLTDGTMILAVVFYWLIATIA